MVAASRRGWVDWALFDCGMVRFLTRREQRRRLVAGPDPMTGEPDLYADMFPIYE